MILSGLLRRCAGPQCRERADRDRYCPRHRMQLDALHAWVEQMSTPG